MSFDPAQPVLVLDTCSERSLVAVCREGAVLAALDWLCERNHSQELVPAIDLVMERTGVARSDLGGVIVTVGPGSYAGLRVGVSAARGLAFALGIPCVGVERLAADALGPLSLGLPEAGVAMEAGRSQYGLARYRSCDGLPAEIEPARPASAEEVANAKQPLYGQGPGVTPWRRRAEDLLTIGLCYLAAPDEYPARPLYLREPSITRPTRASF